MRICNDAGKCNFIIWMLEDTELGYQMKFRYYLWYDTLKTFDMKSWIINRVSVTVCKTYESVSNVTLLKWLNRKEMSDEKIQHLQCGWWVFGHDWSLLCIQFYLLQLIQTSMNFASLATHLSPISLCSVLRASTSWFEAFRSIWSPSRKVTIVNPLNK